MLFFFSNFYYQTYVLHKRQLKQKLSTSAGGVSSSMVHQSETNGVLARDGLRSRKVEVNGNNNANKTSPRRH